MARGGGLAQLAGLALLAGAGWEVFRSGGILQQVTAKTASTAPSTGGGGGGGTRSSGTRSSTSNWVALSITDTGGVPLEHMGNRVRQSADWIAEYSPGFPANEYSVGAYFLDPDTGDGLKWTTGATLQDVVTGATTQLDDWRA